MKEYVGKEMYGFEFKDKSYVTYNKECMDNFIGKIGKIIDHTYTMVVVKFEESKDVWHYPTHFVDEHLVENKSPINLDELFNQIKQL